MRHAAHLICLGAAYACMVGCAEDKVYPGFYGEPREQAITGGPGGGAGASSVPGGVSGGPGGTGGTGAMAMAGSSGMSMPPPAGMGGSMASSMAGQGGSAGAPPAGGSGSNDSPPAACDLSGRWLVTMHYVTDALGQYQTIHSFAYYEIARQADGYAITKGLHCGDEGLAEGLFAVTADFRSTWEPVMRRLSYAGRAVSSTAISNGCDVRFGRWYIVRGATYPYYADPSIPLPTLAQPASGATPGWEDWDEDGQPGITGLISGTVTGKIFVAPRLWSEMGGVVAEAGARLRLPLAWNQEYNMLSFDGTPLLASEAVRAADPSLHFAELARLGDAQATGDDLAICRAVVELAPTLTPAAAAL